MEKSKPGTPTRRVLSWYDDSDIRSGGVFRWAADEDKQNHDGAFVISPTWNNGFWGDVTTAWFDADLGDTGMGCWKREIPAYISPRLFGARQGMGFESINNVALQAWANFISSQNGLAEASLVSGLLDGSFVYDTPLVLYPNTTIVGNGIHGRSRLIHNGPQALRIDGDDWNNPSDNTHTILLRDFNIDGRNCAAGTDFVLVKDSYRVRVHNVYVQVDGSQVQVGFAVRGICNNNLFESLAVNGQGNPRVPIGIAVEVDDASQAIFINPGVEESTHGIEVFAGGCDVFAPYIERSGVHFYFETSAHRRDVNVYGGILRSGAASPIGIRFVGNLDNMNCSVYSPKRAFVGSRADQSNFILADTLNVTGNINIFGIKRDYINDPDGHLNIFVRDSMQSEINIDAVDATGWNDLNDALIDISARLADLEGS